MDDEYAQLDHVAQLDHEYAQLDAPLLAMLGHDLMTEIIVALNGGKIGICAMHVNGYLSPGYQGGRELDFFEISCDAMVFWKHVCKYLRHSSIIYNQTKHLLLSDKEPRIDVWEDPYVDEYGGCDGDEYHNRERYVPRHFFSGKSARPWIMLLCAGPQSHKEVLAMEAAWEAKQAKIATREARKEKRLADAAVALVEGWGLGQRRLRSRK